MCRFIVYKGEETSPSHLLYHTQHSLITQSLSSEYRKNPVNGDGFGVAWYPLHEDIEAGVFTSVEPAWSNKNLRMIASKVRTKHYFAHVRDASVGMPVTQTNCHPFHYGKYTFMHNGKIGEFSRLKRAIQNRLSDNSFNMITGNTDSEHIFALIMETLQRDQNAEANKIMEAITQAIHTIKSLQKEYSVAQPATLNLALSNGEITICSRYVTCPNHSPASLFYGKGNATLRDGEMHYSKQNLTSAQSVIVCSEPLNDDDHYWQEIPRNHSIVINRMNEVTISKIE